MFGICSNALDAEFREDTLSNKNKFSIQGLEWQRSVYMAEILLYCPILPVPTNDQLLGEEITVKFEVNISKADRLVRVYTGGYG